MSGLVMTAVLCAALLHAAWNVIVKSGRDKFLDAVLVACGAGISICRRPCLPWAMRS